MDDFRFLGKELRSFGAMAAFGASMRVGAKMKRSEYELPGGGSVIIGEDTYQTTQRQVTIVPMDGVEPTPRWRREILSWLQSSRGELIVHNDGDVMRLAQFDQDGTWGTQGWPDGQIQLTMTMQPLAYARHESVYSAQSTGGAAGIMISAPSAIPMPLRILVKVTSGTLTALTLTVGNDSLSLGGMKLASGQKIEYDAGSLIGDVMSLKIANAVGFANVNAWAKLTAMPGMTLNARATGAQISLTAICRGRWPT